MARGRSAAKGRGCFAAFDRAYSAFERLAVRIVIARVHEPARITALDITLECGGQMDRRGDRAGSPESIACPAAQPKFQFSFLFVVDSKSRRDGVFCHVESRRGGKTSLTIYSNRFLGPSRTGKFAPSDKIAANCI